MPVRIPKAKTSEVLCFGAAGVSAFAPFYMLMPGAEERLAKQTVKWAPQWERNITFFKSPVERSVKRITPPVAKTVQRIDRNLPLEKVAKRSENRIKKNFALIGVKPQ
ncbi:hypothetical protein GQ53DRAFT_743726 [Thozetella sp. PMI_491]|nr:hypothetical protein GQ53DRAFT_743726 [Thozetella sp. PMI_491]